MNLKTTPANYCEGYAICFFFHKYNDDDDNNEDDYFIKDKYVDE